MCVTARSQCRKLHKFVWYNSLEPPAYTCVLDTWYTTGTGNTLSVWQLMKVQLLPLISEARTTLKYSHESYIQLLHS